MTIRPVCATGLASSGQGVVPATSVVRHSGPRQTSLVQSSKQRADLSFTDRNVPMLPYYRRAGHGDVADEPGGVEEERLASMPARDALSLCYGRSFGPQASSRRPASVPESRLDSVGRRSEPGRRLAGRCQGRTREQGWPPPAPRSSLARGWASLRSHACRANGLSVIIGATRLAFAAPASAVIR